MFDINIPNNNIAELVAIFYALAFFIKHAENVPCLHLHTDSNLYATMRNHQAAPLSAPRLASTVCALSRLLAPRLTVHHVVAHDGHPWNELADVATKAAAQRRLTPHDTRPHPDWLDLNLNVWSAAWTYQEACPLNKYPSTGRVANPHAAARQWDKPISRYRQRRT